MNSILDSVKKALGITSEYEHFDADLIMHINSVLSLLTQLGVGPVNGYSIEDKTATWTDFIQDDKQLQMVKSYVYLKVRLLFDPPQSSAVMDCIKTQILELEWRLNVVSENKL